MRRWLFLLLFLPTSVLASVLTVAFREPIQGVGELTKQLTERMLFSSEQNIELRWEEMPLKRAQFSMVKGVIDIDFARTRFAYDKSDPVVFTSEAIFSINYHLFARTHVLVADDYQRVVGVIGDQLSAEIAKRHQWRMVWARSETDALAMVQNGRVEAMVGFGGIEQVLDRPSLSHVVASEKPVASIPVYLVFHKRHQLLAERASVALARMKQNGEITALFKEHGLLAR
ncbi:transporter substrate-binding domain-containing protein [Salinivibrio sp. VYel6]|uniref:substrate-binding periplasmic protein n=1 Tax=Salinivibrio sp. VYel6 TaxID=2490493 RepID=UPI00128DD647|nr:transporter substrate-binding domain-containing protein [Salinivibrio sp. VYel6]MPX98178.1 transporter substrate-binding domain-containing protein [Salinivibrio sp. VYel6]